MHYLANLTALNHQGCLYALSYRYEVVMHRANGQQRGDSRHRGVDVAIGKDDVVDPLVDRLLRLAAELTQGLLQSGTTPLGLEEHWQFGALESLVADVAEQVELRIGQDGVVQTHHLTVAFVRRQDVHTYRTDVLRERHHQLLADGVDRRVGYLGKLLTEVVEEELRLVAQYGQRRVITHGRDRL